MKKITLFIIMLIVLFPIFSSWELKTREVKDEFGDVTSKNDYYINGSWNNQYTDKFIFFFVGDNEFHNGYMAFGEQGSKSNETYTATVKIKEQDGTVQSFTCKGETLSNSSYWCCDISIDSSTAKKMIDVFSRNDSVKVSVTYGKSSETYNYYTSRKLRFPSIISLIVPLEDRKVNAIIEIAKKISSRFKLEYIRDL